ncbi:MAG TPA: VWA domain-containing protein [Sandaracinaceae bacterium LLY-WYZ-13_1]|nr:VWA domain-containing protein [Sandaracinaceae bacterium LLY-WYZ-13_1]
MRSVRWMVAAGVLLAGCAADPDGEGRPCMSNDDCGGGRCIDGYCEASADAGATDAAAEDAGGPPSMDAWMPMPDAGPPPVDSGFPTGDAGFDPFGDSDGDGISDFHEGRGMDVDTDGDSTPDWMDPDSDADGIPDLFEAGDSDPATPPVDSDFDGTPDFRDLDSDDNGIPDSTEGRGDVDGDSRPAFRDSDNDGDGLGDVDEIGGDPSMPRDTDGDGTPDYESPDSDGDFIHDATEAGMDTDGDGTPDVRDLDSDGDGYEDREEAGDFLIDTPPVDTDGNGIANFRDPDSDADGLSDAAERASGTSPTDADSDGDGVSDLIEVGAGTDPLDSGDSPRTRGDFVFVVPYMMPPDPTRDTLQFDTTLQKADVYFLMDNTGSMGGTISALQSGLTSTVIPDIRARVPDAWFGVGGFDDYPLGGYGQPGYSTDSVGIVHDQAFFQYQTMTSSAATAQTAVNRYRTNYGVDGPESGVAALYALASRSTLSGYARFPGNTTTPPSCAAGHRGMACFRPDAVPIVVVMTDVDQHNSPTCGCNYSGVPGAPSWSTMTSALAGIDARVVGIATSSGANGFLNRLVTDTTIARGAPGPVSSYVLSAPGGSGLSTAVTDAVRQAAAVPLDVSAQASDIVDPGETTDAVAAFLDRLETRTTAASGLICTTGLSTYDRAGIDGDSHPDTFRDVDPGDPVCFDIVPKTNTTVMPTLDPQLFRAQVDVLGDGFTPLDSRVVYFLVPPRIPDPNE